MREVAISAMMLLLLSKAYQLSNNAHWLISRETVQWRSKRIGKQVAGRLKFEAASMDVTRLEVWLHRDVVAGATSTRMRLERGS